MMRCSLSCVLIGALMISRQNEREHKNVASNHKILLKIMEDLDYLRRHNKFWYATLADECLVMILC
jgi:hypothetical protein